MTLKTLYNRAIKPMLLVFTLTLAFSCKKFLEEKPRSFVSSQDLYTSATNAELALTGVYDVLNAASIQGQGNQPLWGRGMQYMTMLGDEITPALSVISDPYMKDVASVAYNSETQLVTDVWFSLYAGINRANGIIENVPSINMDATRKAQIIAEARFLRSYYAFYLAILYGGVPFPQTYHVDAKAPRLPLNEVYALIEQDFTHAYQTLSNRNGKAGRVNKWTAAGFLLKMYTYLASSKENNVGVSLNFPLNSFSWVDANAYYNKALTIAKDIHTNSQYKLVTPYYAPFYADTKTQQKEEALMLVQTGAGGSQEYFLFSYWTGPQGNITVDGGNYGWIRPIGELAQKFKNTDPRFIHNFTGTTGGTTTTQLINGATYHVPYTVNTLGNNLCFSKWRQSVPSNRSQIGFPTWASNIDWPILRYADILLLYAEAAYKTGDETKARGLLSELRTRAATQNNVVNTVLLNDLTATYLKSNFMDELLDERSRELCGEGWRRFDLIRFGKMASTLSSIATTNVTPPYFFYNNNMATVKSNFQDYKIWFPVPKREIAANPNLMSNNPGY